MRSLKLLLPYLIVIIVLATSLSNLTKFVSILAVTLIFYWPLSKKEIYLFIFSSLFFIPNDIGAIQNNFFTFSNPDFFGIPLWEFVAWGFWILFAYRTLPREFPKNLDVKSVIFSLAFAQTFMLFKDKQSILIASTTVLIFSIIFFNSIIDLIYLSFFALIGIGVEFIGIYFNLWSYPEADLFVSHLQFVVMWAGVGLYFRQLVGPFLIDRKTSTIIIRNVFFNNQTVKNIENDLIQGHQGIPQSFESLMVIYEKNFKEGNARKVIESLREALSSSKNPIEKAKAHLLLAQNYRMLVQMRNAKLELEAAFYELNLDFPRNFSLQTAKYGLIFLVHYFFKKNDPTQIETDDLTKLKVALFEEVGLSGYYLRQDLLMLQASFRAFLESKKKLNSIEYVNWLGGTMIVLILKGFINEHLKIKNQAHKIINESKNNFITFKWKIWEALAIDYLGNSKNSALVFEEILYNRQYLKAEDLRLSALTLSCNYSLRGHFKKSISSLEYLFESAKDEKITYLSRTRTYVDWYSIGARGILSDMPSDHEMFRSSKAIFNQTDEEKWAISQYLGNLIVYYYFNQKLDRTEIISIEERFHALKLRPQKTYLESSMFWIVICLIKMDGHAKKIFSEKEIYLSVKDVRNLQDHPTVNQFKSIIEDRYQVLIKKDQQVRLNANLEQLALETDNLFSLFECYKNILILNSGSNNELNKKTEVYQKMKTFIMTNEWKNYPLSIELFSRT